MFRSPDAGFRRSVLITAVFLTGFAGPALGGDWQPITGSQSQATPQPPNRPSGSGGGYGGIMTWGRGGGLSGEPDHPHPPVTSTTPAAANCGLRIDPPTALAGEYATVVATLSNTALRDLGRMELLVGGQVASGVTQQGGSFTYAFRVPEGERQVDVSLTAYASRTSAYGQFGILCSATASLTVMNLVLEGPKKVREGGLVSAAATVTGGQPPFRFEWFPSGRIQGSGSESVFYANFEDVGTHRVSVTATDAGGRQLSRTTQVQVVRCPSMEVSGPNELKAGETGAWTVTFPTPFLPYKIDAEYGPSGSTHIAVYEATWTFYIEARPEVTRIFVIAEDREGCIATTTLYLRVVAAPTSTTGSDTSSASGGCQDPQGCACPGGGRTWQVGQTCCGSVICQPGARCIAPGNCR